MFIVALALGIGAATMANNWVQARIQSSSARDDLSRVVVASLEIPFGAKIESAQLKTIEWPNRNVPNSAFTDPDEVVGKIATRGLLPDEIILSDRVTDHLGGSTLAAIVAPNKRAISVRVNDVIGVSGFLLPGNHVDVLATRKADRRAETRTALERIKVLAVDQTASTDKDEPVVVRAVTLEMTPSETETLVKAMAEGTLQLTLRNPLDDVKTVVAEKPKPVIKKAAAPRSYVNKVTIIRGTAVQTSRVKQ
jgi:pilus assembly protein CpaB